MRLTEPKKVRTIVFDSWDALAKELDPKERLRAEKTLIALANNSGAQLVFVSEEPGATTIDYLVDGILEMVMRRRAGPHCPGVHHTQAARDEDTPAQVHLHASGWEVHVLRTLHHPRLLQDEQVRADARHRRVLLFRERRSGQALWRHGPREHPDRSNTTRTSPTPRSGQSSCLPSSTSCRWGGARSFCRCRARTTR